MIHFHKTLFLFTVLPLSLLADNHGADPRLTGAPGDQNCTGCHSGTVNSGGGSVKISLASGNSYTPGVKQRVTVEVADSAERRWGFELSARLASNLSNGQAGSFTATDGNTQVKCETGRTAPCTSDTVIQFVTHTLAGSRLGTTGGVSFEFDWTPPATDVGSVWMYAAGNAANGDNRNSGDHIYTASVEVKPAVTAPRPTLSSEKAVVNAAGLDGSIAPNTWITITGTNLAAVSRTWTADEIATGGLPTSLEGVSVSINGKAAFIEYVSPAKINALTPADDSRGQVQLTVTSNGQTSDALTVNLQQVAPAIFTFDGKYVATAVGENAKLDKSAEFLAAKDAAATMKPGDTLELYGTGFGATDEGGLVVSAIAATVGGVDAKVISAGLMPGLPQIYQIRLEIPDAVGDGDQKVIVKADTTSTPERDGYALITIQR